MKYVLLLKVSVCLTVIEFRECNPETDKMLILISSVVYWSSVNSETPLEDNDFVNRITPLSNLEQRDIENEVLSACRITTESDYGTIHPHKRSYVICPGLVYGMGEEYEESLYHVFMNGWNYIPGQEFPIIGEGTNVIPSIHIKDLAKVTAKVAINKPNPREHPYILAIDKSGSEQTQEKIIKAIAEKVGIENIKKVPLNQIESDQIKQILYPLTLNLNMKLGSYLEELMGTDWVSEGGLVQNIENVFNELKEARGLRCVKSLLIGPPISGKTYFSDW